MSYLPFLSKIDFKKEEFFMSFGTYKLLNGQDKTKADYLTYYLKHHPHARETLATSLSVTIGTATRLFDKLPSSFWADDLQKEYNTIHSILNADFAACGIDITKLNREDYAKNREKFDELKLPGLEKYVLSRVSQFYRLLYSRNGSLNPQIAKMIPALNSEELREYVLSALFVSYSQAVSEQYINSLTDIHNRKARDNALNNFSIAIFTPISNVLKKSSHQAFMQRLDELNDFIESLKKKLKRYENDRAKLAPNDPRYMQYDVTCDTLQQIIINNSNIINDGVLVSDDYIREEKNKVRAILFAELIAFNKAINVSIKKLKNEIDIIVEQKRKNWAAVTDGEQLSSVTDESDPCQLLINAKVELQRVVGENENIISNFHNISVDYVEKQKIKMETTLNKCLLNNEVAKEHPDFVKRILNMVLGILNGWRSNIFKTPIEKLVTGISNSLHIDTAPKPRMLKAG